MEPLSSAIARVMQRVFTDSLLTQKELERRSGVSQTKISMGMRGLEAFTTDQLDALCAALGIDVAAVVHEADASRRE